MWYPPAYQPIFTMDAWKKKLDDVKIQKEDLDKLVMDFLVTEGWVETAEKFNSESGTEQLASPYGIIAGIDLATIRDRCAIRKALWCGNIDDAVEKIIELNPEILEATSRLFLRIQQQRFIEAIREGKTEEALKISQEELALCAENLFKFESAQNIAPEISESRHLPKRSVFDKLERTLILLAFKDPSESPRGKLMKLSRRQKTAREVNSAILAGQGHEEDSKLFIIMKTLLWEQKELAKVVIFPRMDYSFETEELKDPYSLHP